MSVANLVIFLIAVAALALLVWQNLSPAVSVVFLGSQSPTFPLSFWIVMAIAIGVILALLIWGLFQISATGSHVSPRSPSRSPKPPVQPMGFTSKPDVEPEPSYSTTPNYTKTSTTTSTTSSRSTQSKATRSTTRNNDDWETEVRPIPQSWDQEDWGLDEEEEPAYSTPSETRLEEEPQSEAFEESSEPEAPRRDNYEVEQKPKRESWSGSVYSYGYREGGDTGVGKSESVYDADYRVITPPPPPTTIQDEEEHQQQEFTKDNPETSSTHSDPSDNPQHPPKS